MLNLYVSSIFSFHLYVVKLLYYGLVVPLGLGQEKITFWPDATNIAEKLPHHLVKNSQFLAAYCPYVSAKFLGFVATR